MKRISPNEPVWHIVVGNIEEQIENLRASLERDVDEKTTAATRGRIAALRSVLDWPNIGPTEPTEGIEFI